jgi:hypothetical protein
MRTDAKYWKGEADRLFSLWIRQRFADGDYVACATCANVGEWRYMDCGHFRLRKHNSTRCHELNAMAQCPSCNRGDGKGHHANGEQYLMGLSLDAQFGNGTAQSMIELEKKTVKTDWLFWQERAHYFKNLLIENGLKIR